MLPMYEDIEGPLLRELLRRGGSARPGDKFEGKTVYESLGAFFKLTKADYDECVIEPGSGTPRSKWENMVRWARRKLVDRDLLDSSGHGVWALTAEGKRRAKSGG